MDSRHAKANIAIKNMSRNKILLNVSITKNNLKFKHLLEHWRC